MLHQQILVLVNDRLQGIRTLNKIAEAGRGERHIQIRYLPIHIDEANPGFQQLLTGGDTLLRRFKFLGRFLS